MLPAAGESRGGHLRALVPLTPWNPRGETDQVCLGMEDQTGLGPVSASHQNSVKFTF